MLDLDLDQELARADYIMLNYGTGALYELGSHFLPKALLHLCYDKAGIDAEVNKLVHKIKSDPEWFAENKKKVEDKHEDLEQGLYNIALYMISRCPEKYIEDLQGDKMPTSRNKDLIILREKQRKSYK